MNKVKVRFLTIASLILLLVGVIALALCAAFPRRAAADDVDPVAYEPSAVFAAGVGGEVGASEGTPSFVEFSLSDEGSVHFRRDLALKWFEADSAESALATPGKANYFSMRFAFPSVAFETLTLSFESDEENVTKEAKAVNSLVFVKGADGALTVKVKNAAAQEAKNDDASLPSGTIAADAAASDLVLTFGASATGDAGSYHIVLTCGDAVVLGSEFTNIGGNYLEYRSSASTTPNTPLTFTAELPEGAAADAAQSVLMKELNGQGFTLTDGKVQDDTAPVLAINESVYAFRLGTRFSLDYEAIDVCDDSVSVTRHYYMAEKNDEGAYVAPTSDDYGTLTTSTYFMPVTDEDKEYVSIYFNLDDDRTSSDGISDNGAHVYLSWYAAEGAGVVETLNGCDYIRVDREQQGPAYVGLTATAGDENNAASNVGDAAFEEAVSAYETALNAAAEKTSAGTGAYLYLPSLRGLIEGKTADYRNLSFNVYYYHETAAADSSASSATSLDYNELRIEVSRDGWYRLRFVVTDASDNAMQYYDEDGELVDVTSSNVWDIKGIPEFRVYIGYEGATIEAPEAQDFGYRDRSYSIDDFEVIALEGYLEEYTLYYLDPALLGEGQTMPTYEDCVANAETYVNETYKDSGIVEINKYNDKVTEDDENWDDTDNAYHWDPDSALSFVPQKSGIYFVKLVVTDPNLPEQSPEGYMAIEVRNPVDIIPGQTYWIQNNITAVVLFAVSAVLLIVIVVLFVVKPSDKKVKEVDLKKLKGRPKK